MSLYLGIDFGTSGARCAVIDRQGQVQAEGRYPFNMAMVADLPTCWHEALFAILGQIPLDIRKRIKAIAINGTSATVMLCDRLGKPVDAPLLYNDARGADLLAQLKKIAPANHTVLSATSSLVKLLWFSQLTSFSQAKYFLHQADWLGFLLHGKLGISDYHNALKLGYDVEKLEYPDWLTKFLKKLNSTVELPKIFTPGEAVGTITPEIATRFNFPPDCLICAGTTDSIAAFLASGAKTPGEAVTSLGSTLAVKLLSRTYVEDTRYGIYSHRFPNFGQEQTQQEKDLWLVGGASNTGGAVLRHFFSNDELDSLSREIDAAKISELDYYPLLKAGERFPVNDANLQPQLEPRPENNAEFLHGLLESIARIEARGYKLLQQLGADKLNRVYTAGGGATNTTWIAIRQRYLNVPVESSVNAEAAYGSALLAMGKT
ncbi:MAG: FGGY-family carbohydrate kinase [Methylacidiphilales bacterium]|nr:FGGY-family carbohydrate kinase [Candidatus Methylacidiphilales bacterium]NJR15197.1 FGGY-family carbohydrate kinase [Calothrix sp. CSU_2_0]